jgi:hypothetical protein
MELLAVCYEELGLVRIWTRVGHRHHAARVELGSEQRTREGSQPPTGKEGEGSWSTPKVGIALVSHFDGGSDFVLERLSPDRLATLPQTNGITGLDHESLDVAVENATVVIVGSTKGQKVLRQQGEGEWLCGAGGESRRYTSAALGTASQKTSTLRSPRVVWRVTDCSRRGRMRVHSGGKRFEKKVYHAVSCASLR